MIHSKPAKVYAIIVTFQPDEEKLCNLLIAISSQVQGILIVDNGSTNSVVPGLLTKSMSFPFDVISLGQNFGIARAQNVGIGVAKTNGADHIILFDQDSAPASDLVVRLLAAVYQQAANGHLVASVGPNYLDPRQKNPPPFIKILGLRLIRQTCVDNSCIVDVDYLIASGCLIPMATIDAVGTMREDFFIDYVDIEWGLRAMAKGYRSFGVCGAMMAHDLGDDPIVFMGKRFPLHSPTRHYYHFRNAIWMYRQSWLPLNWRLVDCWRLILKFGFYSLMAKPRLQHFRMMAKGIWHGLIGQMGPLQ